MKPYYKIIIVAENATDLKVKSLELAEQFKTTDVVKNAEPVESLNVVREEAVKAMDTFKEKLITPSIEHIEQVLQTAEAQFPIQQDVHVKGLSAPYLEQESELDSAGMPHDIRIHLERKKKNQDGTWTKQRRLEKDFVAAVEAELKGVSVAQPVELPKTPINFPPMSPPVLEEPKAPVIEAPKGIAEAHTLETFKKNLPLILIELTNEKKINEQYINNIKTWLSVSEVVNVIGDEEKTKSLFDLFVNHKLIKSV